MSCRRRIVSASIDVQVPDGDVAEHLLEQMDEIVARREASEVWLEASSRGSPIEAVKIRIIEEIALDPPCIVIHLPPLLARVDVCLELRDVQRTAPRLRLLHRRHDHPLRFLAAHAHECLLAISRDRERGDAIQHLLELALFEIEAIRRCRRWRSAVRIHRGGDAETLEQEQRAGLAAAQLHVVPCRDGQCQDALIDAVEVDADGARGGQLG